MKPTDLLGGRLGSSIGNWLAAGLLLSALAAPAGAAEPPKPNPRMATATFAGGCFWCMEHPFDQLPGVLSVTAGYTGGTKDHPSYEQVSSGSTGHAESVQVAYDPAKITYQRLLEVFWHNIDPVASNRQFCDVGSQYRSAIFYQDDAQKQLAEASKAELQKRFKQPIATQVVAASTFWPAEDYHQHYYKKNPTRYQFYRFGCGRDQRLAQVWGKSAE
jgi:peptide-methionine (S)-S-oxide reductase